MEDLDALKRDPRVLQIYGQYTQLKREGDKYRGLCCFHHEKTGSFTVFKDMLFRCFGCGEQGNIFQLVEKKDNISFKQAVEKVKSALGGSNWSRDAAAVDAVFKPVQDAPKSFKTYTLSEYAVFEKALVNSLEAVHFLDRRGITLATAQKLHLGYRKSIKLGGPDADLADKGWLAIPRIDGETVVAIHYRSVVEGRKAFSRQPGMRTELMGLELIDPFDPIYVVEGEFDLLSLVQSGFNAVSIPSASANLTPQQKDRLMQAGTVILAGDCDGAKGEEMMNKLWRELSERTYLLKWDGCKDANEVLLKTCKGDTTAFRAEVERLTQQAKTQPMPDLYSLTDVMLNSSETKVTDRADRLHLPWKEVDQMANILPGSVLALYATQTGMGKTAWATQVSLYGARKYNEVVVSYQCEMSPEEIAVMVAAQVLRKNRNFLTKQDQIEAAGILQGIQYYIGTTTLEDPDQILDLLESAVRRFGATCLVIDHFHHLTRSATNETAIQGAVAKRIKAIARKYQLKVINVGQPKKADRSTKGKRTHITDAKGSAAYTDDADAVFAIHRELCKSDEDQPIKDTYESKTLIHAQKTRSKGIGSAEAYVTFFGEFGCFESVTDIYGENPA